MRNTLIELPNPPASFNCFIRFSRYAVGSMAAWLENDWNECMHGPFLQHSQQLLLSTSGEKISHSYTACKDFLWRGGGVSLVCKGSFCKYVRIRLTGPLLSVWLLWPRQCGLHCGHFGLHQPQRAPAGNLLVSPLPSSRVESPGVQCFVNEKKLANFQ